MSFSSLATRTFSSKEAYSGLFSSCGSEPRFSAKKAGTFAVTTLMAFKPDASGLLSYMTDDIKRPVVFDRPFEPENLSGLAAQERNFKLALTVRSLTKRADNQENRIVNTFEQNSRNKNVVQDGRLVVSQARQLSRKVPSEGLRPFSGISSKGEQNLASNFPRALDT